MYIGRAGIVFVEKERFPKKSSEFHNPFKIGKDGTREEKIKIRKSIIRTYITDKLKNNNQLIEELIKLKDCHKNLGCWCYPEKCHGNILLELI